jgi:hypothetical protein
MENSVKPGKEIKREEVNESFELVDINNVHSKNLLQSERNSRRGKIISSEKEKNKKEKNKKGSIPFISKFQGKDDRTLSIKSDKNDDSCSDQESLDEIDHLINKYGSRSKVIIEDKAHVNLDFDDDMLKTEKQKKNIKPVNEKNKNMKINHMLLKKPQINSTGNSELSINNTNTSLQTNITKSTKPQSNSNKNPPKINSEKEHAPAFPDRVKIIDPVIVNKKLKVSNSDLLLTIFEICLFSNEYGFRYKSKSKVFWEDICKKENYKNIFAKYKPDTLKKYWSLLSEVKDYQKVIELIHMYKDLIDLEDLK